MKSKGNKLLTIYGAFGRLSNHRIRRIQTFIEQISTTIVRPLSGSNVQKWNGFYKHSIPIGLYKNIQEIHTEN